MTKTNVYPLMSVVIVVVLLFLAYMLGTGQSPAFGSTPAEASDYNATTTASGAIYGGSTGSGQIKTGFGSFGSVILTGASTAIWNLYDATTTNINLRTGNTASSTILLASFPASIAAGTYTFDVAFKKGLLVDVISGVMPTSTITWR